jgi:hypothetical protein
VISSLLSRFESVVRAMVLSNPESESTVRSEESKKRVRNNSSRKWNNGTDDIRIFENKAKANLTFSNMDVRNVPRYDQIREDVARLQRTLSSCLPFIGH